jgi:choline dehydrogenase-like flavoprotein
VTAAAGEPFLRPRERRTVAALAEVLFAREDGALLTPDEVAERVDAQLQLMRATKRIRSLRLVLAVVEYVLPLAGLTVLGIHVRWFSRLPACRRKRLVEATLARTRFKPLRTLSKIKALLVAAYYSDEAVQDRIGFVPVRDRDGDLDLTPDDRGSVRVHEPAGDELEVDVCVIGSGAGGALVAARAAAADRSVALLEEGPYFPQCKVEHDEHRMIATLYKEHGLQMTVDFGTTILQGRVLGGSTFVNNAICFRLGDKGLRTPQGASVLEDWRLLGAGIDEEALHDSYSRIERELGVRRVRDDLVGASGHALCDGWGALNGAGRPGAPRSGVFRKNLQGCVGCGYCNFACPYGHKLSALEGYVKRVGDHDRGYVIPQCHAEKLVREGDRVVAVRARLGDGRMLTVKARTVVVAAGAIGSSVLLLKNGFRRNVGTRFSFNAATPVVAAFDEPRHSWAADQMTAYVDSGLHLLESSFDPPMSFALRVPGWFGEHMRRMEDYDRLVGLGVVVGTEPNGRVKRWPLFRDFIGPVKWTMTERDLATMKRGIGLAAAVYFKAGAREVYVASFLDCCLDADKYTRHGEPDAEAIAAAIDAAVRGPGDLLLTSAHPQGGNPMSDDPGIGVVGRDFRVHGTRNLYVCDASVFPTSIHINPQLTIMAMADMAWGRSIAGVTA